MREDVSKKLESLKERHAKIYTDIVEKNYSDMRFEPKDVCGKDILDLGAHIGVFSLFCLMHGAKSVMSVEANPKTFMELAANTSSFREISILNKAVTGGETAHVMMSDKDAQSMIIKEGGTKVPTVTIDELVQVMPKSGERLLKVDIEGSEYQVLPWASAKAIRSFQIIFLETHNVDGEPVQTYEFLKHYLESLGYVETCKNQCFWWTFDAAGTVQEVSPIPNMGCWRFELGE